LPEAVRASLPLWFASRVAVAVGSLAAARALYKGPVDNIPSFTRLWDRWDVGLFTKVARFGYFSPEYADRTEVDFPGLPLAIRLVHLIVSDWIVAGLLVAFTAGAVAAASVWQLAADEVGPQGARFAVISLIFFPYAVFLFAAYSEPIFLGFATASWLAARRGHWWPAGLLGAGAASTRIAGIPFCLAFGVAYVVMRRRSGQPLLARPALAVAIPPLPILGYFAYLRAHTGHWHAYTDAMWDGWGRRVDWPWKGWMATWDSAFDGSGASTWVWFFRGELAAVIVGVVLTAALARARRWDEATFLGASTLLMSCTNYYASGIRMILVAFPMYLLLARLASRHRWVAPTYMWLLGPVMAVFVVAFTQNYWVD
jgi:hypothetical protein